MNPNSKQGGGKALWFHCEADRWTSCTDRRVLHSESRWVRLISDYCDNTGRVLWRGREFFFFFFRSLLPLAPVRLSSGFLQDSRVAESSCSRQGRFGCYSWRLIVNFNHRESEFISHRSLGFCVACWVFKLYLCALRCVCFTAICTVRGAGFLQY